ncbi:MAG: hypothetical protein ACR2PL_03300, partial [Dehalococcoidia bacterium]
MPFRTVRSAAVSSTIAGLAPPHARHGLVELQERAATDLQDILIGRPNKTIAKYFSIDVIAQQIAGSAPPNGGRQRLHLGLFCHD